MVERISTDKGACKDFTQGASAQVSWLEIDASMCNQEGKILHDQCLQSVHSYLSNHDDNIWQLA